MRPDSDSQADENPFTVWSDTFRNVTIGQAKLIVAEGVDDQWVDGLWNAPGADAEDDAGSAAGEKIVHRQRGHDSVECAGPAGIDRVYAKRYRVRAGHSILRRLGPNRARREGAGHRAFAEKGIPTPRLLVYGDTRKAGLFVEGIVATVVLDAANLIEHYRSTGEKEMIWEATRFLARIHTGGLAHGDACLRNFVVSGSSAMALDLPSWSRLSRKAWLNDLTRFFGTGLKLTADKDFVSHLMDAYHEAYGGFPAKRAALFARAEAYAVETSRP